MTRPLQQHMLRETTAYRALLASIDLTGRTVVEIGVGTGVLTSLILSRNPESVIGYEIDPTLCRLSHPKFELRIEDALTADLTTAGHDPCLISNPPYDLLDDILLMVQDPDPLFADVILMVPLARLAQFSGFDIAFTLGHDAFDPPTSPGVHVVVRRGFNA